MASLSFTRQGLLHLGLGRVTDALALFKRGTWRFELEALELYPGVRSFIEDRGSHAELNGWFQTPST